MSRTEQKNAFNILKKSGIIFSDDEFIEKDADFILAIEEFFAKKVYETEFWQAGVLPIETETDVGEAADLWGNINALW